MIPTKDSLLVPYSTNFNDKIVATPATFSLSAAQAAAYTPLHTAFITAYNAMMAARADGTRSESLTSAKNDAKDDLLAYGRELYSFVQASSSVSDANRILLGVDPKDGGRTPVPAPTARPAMAIASVAARTVTVNVYDATSKTKRGKPDGAVNAFIYSFVGDSYPSDPTAWQFCGPTTKSTYDIVFPDSVANGTQVWFCAVWCNRKGETGPISMPITTNIQGGGANAQVVKTNTTGVNLAA